jgi:hypothetical protein
MCSLCIHHSSTSWHQYAQNEQDALRTTNAHLYLRVHILFLLLLPTGGWKLEVFVHDKRFFSGFGGAEFVSLDGTDRLVSVRERERVRIVR